MCKALITSSGSAPLSIDPDNESVTGDIDPKKAEDVAIKRPDTESNKTVEAKTDEPADDKGDTGNEGDDILTKLFKKFKKHPDNHQQHSNSALERRKQQQHTCH